MFHITIQPWLMYLCCAMQCKRGFRAGHADYMLRRIVPAVGAYTRKAHDERVLTYWDVIGIARPVDGACRGFLPSTAWCDT